MTPSAPDPTQRFSDRVDAYVRYRPGYPDALIQTLRAEADLSPGSVIADVGSGTGISTELFLRSGFEVHAIEPNAAMRTAAERWLGGNARFHSVHGAAEATTLPPGSVDLVAAGQAFHWFDAVRALREFARVLRSTGSVALFWNSRHSDTTPFLRAYEALLHAHGTDYGRVNHRNIDPDRFRGFFPGSYRYFTFPNEQVFDYDGLAGRMLSSSYTPGPQHPRYKAMKEGLLQIFERYQEAGRVRFLYTTELHVGRFR